MSGVSKTGTNFGKKKNSYGCAGQFNADKLLAKYRQVRNTGNIANSFSLNNIDPRSNNLISSVKDKNSRNIEKFGEKAITGSSKQDAKESNSQYMINPESMKSEHANQNMSFDAKPKQRSSKNKKKEEATKALLNFEDMKKKILKDYVKKNNKEISANVAQPSHHRNGANLMTNYFSQNDDQLKRKDLLSDAKSLNTKEDDLFYLTEGTTSKSKKLSKNKNGNKQNYSAIYDSQGHQQFSSNQSLVQNSTSLSGAHILKERPHSNKRPSPQKKQISKTSSNRYD